MTKPGANYWTVPREWPGETVFLLAGGPSLTGFDPEILRGRGRVIAINNSYVLCPWADALYFCDVSWWKHHRDEVLKTFTGKHMISMGMSGDGVRRLRNSGLAGLETDPGGLRHGTNSGYQAINLAYHFGAKRIVLLGYDMRVNASQTNGRKTERAHWHQGHPWNHIDYPAYERIMKENWLPRFSLLAEPLASAGVEILNATPGSALTCWPMRSLEDILQPQTAEVAA